MLARVGDLRAVASMGMGLEYALAESFSVWLSEGALPWALASSFVGGFLTALTPCVYPLIPITVRYFGATDGSTKPGRLVGALSYVLGMGLLYTVLGTLFASMNFVVGGLLASPVFVVTMALVCLAMGLSMLGVFTFQLPASLNARLASVGGRGAVGAFAMGTVSGLVAAPCTGPVLAVILVMISTQGDLGLGVALMGAFSLGLGAPFLLLALASSELSRLPRSGSWMEMVKGVLAVAMFVVAVYFAEIALPAIGVLLDAIDGILGIAILLGGAAFGVAGLKSSSTKTTRALRVASIVALTFGASVGIFADGLNHVDNRSNAIAWVNDYDEGMRRGQVEGKPVMIDFTAEWCVACKKLDTEVFSAASVSEEAGRFIAMKLDATEIDDDMQTLFARYQIMGLPSVLFFDSNGKFLNDTRVTGVLPADAFVDVMRQVP